MAATLLFRRTGEKFQKSQEVDLAYAMPSLGRFRCNCSSSAAPSA